MEAGRGREWGKEGEGAANQTHSLMDPRCENLTPNSSNPYESVWDHGFGGEREKKNIEK